jgi:hypothetical protein
MGVKMNAQHTPRTPGRSGGLRTPIDGSGLSSPISEPQVRKRESIARAQPTCRSALWFGRRDPPFWCCVLYRLDVTALRIRTERTVPERLVGAVSPSAHVSGTGTH